MSNFESRDSAVTVFDTNQWVESNRKDFTPPVCNKCMFSEQLKVFFVGGPNSRNDYHLEEGEEVCGIFFQIKGDMVLKVVENGIQKDVKIREGELFLLPAYVEHSPQRFENTLGCVVERERSSDEYDCVRYFVDGTDNQILWERWFHLKDVVKDLPPVIRKFNESAEKANGKPGDGSFEREAPYKPKNLKLPSPINLAEYIDKNLTEINKTPQHLFKEVDARAQLILYGNGTHQLKAEANELVLLFQRGSGELIYESESTKIQSYFATRVKPKSKVTLKIADGVCLVASIPPK
ncbi:hypothetical protein M3Y98_00153000 [Aphelenchoides besseyi]|nr:hypothetical protein M3Y98_00153000 [Aphelenchoides besseyi]KAI6199818.1 hypothetical protein M3Y96_00667400 [Aphelenchoides besseyi]